jgi:hypothetical protein
MCVASLPALSKRSCGRNPDVPQAVVQLLTNVVSTAKTESSIASEAVSILIK